MPLIAQNNSIHIAPPDTDYRSSTCLRFERHQSEGFLDARMYEQVSRPVDRCQFILGRDVSEPGNRFCASRQIAKLISQRAIANHQQMKPSGVRTVQNLKSAQESLNVLFMSEPANVEKEKSVGRDLHPTSGSVSIFTGSKDIGVDPQFCQDDIFNSPLGQHLT